MHPWIMLRPDQQTVVVTPVGDLDMVAAGSLRTALSDATSWGLPVVVDLSLVSELESAALAVLVGGRNRLLERGEHLTISHAAPSVWQVFHATGLDRVLAVQPFR